MFRPLSIFTRPLVALRNAANGLFHDPRNRASNSDNESDNTFTMSATTTDTDDTESQEAESSSQQSQSAPSVVEMEAVESDPLLGRRNQKHEEQEEETSGMLSTITEGVKHRMSSIVEKTEEVVEAAGEAIHDVQEAIVEEIHIAQQGLMEELHEAEDGDVFFLEMALTRNLSILPGDRNLVEAVEEAADIVQSTHHDIDDTAHEDDDDEHDEELGEVGHLKPAHVAPSATTTAATATRTPLSAYVLLLSAVISLSSIGPFLDYQQGVGACMKIFWRTTGTALLLAPMAIRSLVIHNRDGIHIPRLSLTQWCTFALASASYVVLCVAFVMALDFTSVGNAVILSNTQALILLAGKLCVGASIHFMEGTGALVAFAGAILCSRDHSSIVAQASPEDASAGMSTLYGDCLAMISAIGGVFYLTFGKAIRMEIGDVYVFMFVNMTMGSCFTLLFMLATGQDVSFSRDIDIGLWGWMNLRTDRLPLEIAMVVVCNILGALGYVRAFKYFDNLVISVAALMEPVVASFIAFQMGVGVLPGTMGWIGNVLVASGTLSVVYPTASKGSGSH